jgi:hypothetical protein
VFEFRVTDRHNNATAGGTGDSGTVIDIPFPVDVQCLANPTGGLPTAIGATCAAVTRVNAIVPGAIQPGKRGNWGIEAVQVYDGGPGGVAGAPDASVFLRQGVFVP